MYVHQYTHIQCTCVYSAGTHLRQMFTHTSVCYPITLTADWADVLKRPDAVLTSAFSDIYKPV